MPNIDGTWTPMDAMPAAERERFWKVNTRLGVYLSRGKLHVSTSVSTYLPAEDSKHSHT